MGAGHQRARRHVTVAVGGDGADELLAGYNPFKALRYARWYEKMMPRPVHRAVSMTAARLPVSHRYMSFDFRVKRVLRGMEHQANLRLPAWMSALAPSELESLFQSPIDLEDLFAESIRAWNDSVGDSDVDRAMAFYFNLYLQDDILVKVDRASMLNSLEVRAPFLDIELVDFIRRLPVDIKLRGTSTKWILKQAVQQLLPPHILPRPKQGFGVPIGQWFRDGAIPTWSDRPPINGDFRARKRAAHLGLQSDERAYLWSDWLLSHSHLADGIRNAKR